MREDLGQVTDDGLGHLTDEDHQRIEAIVEGSIRRRQGEDLLATVEASDKARQGPDPLLEVLRQVHQVRTGDDAA